MTPRFATLWVTLQLTYLSLLALGAYFAWAVLRRVNALHRKFDARWNHDTKPTP